MKRALVTGGSGGIGAAICRRLAADGLHVTVHANSRLQEAQRLAAEIASAGGAAQAVAFDVADRARTEAALKGVLAAGPVQVVVNNAGIHDDAVMPAMKPAQWSRVIDVSLNGFFNVTQPLPPVTRARFMQLPPRRPERPSPARSTRPPLPPAA